MHAAQSLVTGADLDWWLDLAPRLTWIWARTYAETAPHWYVVRGRTEGMTDSDYIRAGAVIRTFGEPGKFYDTTNIYLTSPDGSLRWWTMDASVASTGLINQATTEVSYGEQNAPRTRSGQWSVYDEIAVSYDALRAPVDGDERVGLLDLLERLGLDQPRTLDIGCGTGAVLDLGVTVPELYTGVDPSQAMLNELVIKYRRRSPARIIATRIEDAMESLRTERFDLIIAAFGSGSHLTRDVIDELPSMCDGALVLMAFADGCSPAFETSSPGRRPTFPLTWQRMRIGRFETAITVSR
ncbi:MAG: class I SAM-dependent methyltransferase [Microbacteriaceae bacterium]|nr:class I SAM-dependent methyltransferase [Microbacteriaceae bacterium]